MYVVVQLFENPFVVGSPFLKERGSAVLAPAESGLADGDDIMGKTWVFPLWGARSAQFSVQAPAVTV
jgi:hypothetical protein